jgi:anti-sigma regulatory factor (Ser/Thr protein kinase)
MEEAGADRREVFDVTLAMVEAFANAVEHPHARRCQLVDVNGSITDGGVMVSIRDYGTWDDGPKQKADGGLGLVMIEELMDALKVERLWDGTTVTMQRSLNQR